MGKVITGRGQSSKLEEIGIGNKDLTYHTK
jgi:hypothetical protein